jgi:hypothetical protein
MSRPFINISSANKTFGQFKEPKDASEYLHNKKARATYCVANKCAPSIKVYSESERLLFNKSNQLSLYPCANGFNTANLNINLITRLNLRGVPVIQDASSGAVPSTITLDSVPFLDYVIDPSGILFGNSVCGINNFTKLFTPNLQVSPYIIISGDYEITADSSYNTIITFYGNSVIEFTKPIQIDYTIVGGGGGGGATNSVSYGGGGGGQVKIGIFNTSSETFNITIGSGGAGRSSATGLNGGSSSIISTSATITSLGGFGSIANGNGGNSGAGGAGGTFYNGFPPAPSTINGVNGGGGAGGSGQQALAGNGGLNNVKPNYGGGGGGGSGNGFISGGLGVGGGGNGGNVSSNGQNATPNTGGGGGGGGDAGITKGGNGGSGIAIFSFNV